MSTGIIIHQQNGEQKNRTRRTMLTRYRALDEKMRRRMRGSNVEEPPSVRADRQVRARGRHVKIRPWLCRSHARRLRRRIMAKPPDDVLRGSVVYLLHRLYRMPGARHVRVPPNRVPLEAALRRSIDIYVHIVDHVGAGVLVGGLDSVELPARVAHDLTVRSFRPGARLRRGQEAHKGLCDAQHARARRVALDT